MENLTKKEIIKKIWEDQDDLNQIQIKSIVQETLDIIADSLKTGRNVELRNFGVFEVQVRKSRVGRNPNNPQADVIIPKRAVVKFKSGKELKSQLTKIDIKKVENNLNSRKRS